VDLERFLSYHGWTPKNTILIIIHCNHTLLWMAPKLMFIHSIGVLFTSAWPWKQFWAKMKLQGCPRVWRYIYIYIFAYAILLVIAPDQKWAPPWKNSIWSFFWRNWSWILTHYFLKGQYDRRWAHHFLCKEVRLASVRWVECQRLKWKEFKGTVVATHHSLRSKNERWGNSYLEL
jgi:hypothetical protein